jgi:hypothetical protein
MTDARKADGRFAGRAPQTTRGRGRGRFDYDAPAELFLGSRKAARSRPRYQRFDTAAEALRFVIEGLPAGVLAGAYLLVEEARFRSDEFRPLYEGDGYPLPRAAGKLAAGK